MRRLAGLLLALGGCGLAPEGTTVAGQSIACGPADAELSEACTLERNGDHLVVRRPEGGFRRLALTPEGLVSADGAEDAMLARSERGIDVTVGGWTYGVPTARQ